MKFLFLGYLVVVLNWCSAPAPVLPKEDPRPVEVEVLDNFLPLKIIDDPLKQIDFINESIESL